jgi:hypothetical protein
MDAKKDSNHSIMPIVSEAGVDGEGGSQTGERSMQPRHSHHCRTNPLSPRRAECTCRIRRGSRRGCSSTDPKLNISRSGERSEFLGDHPTGPGSGGWRATYQVARHRHDYSRLATEFTHTHPDLQRDPIRDAERAFDRLNPDYGVPADQRSHYGRQAVHDREAALALGVRVAVHDSRQNDRDPAIWQPGQDYRMAEAIHTARHRPTRAGRGPERVGPER